MAAGKSTAPKLPGSRQNIFALMGHSFSVHQIKRKIQQVAHTNFTVIVQGETGTGKELVARLIHENSDRADKPFLAVDCGAIPDTLVESELFGYVKGAFTGAEGNRAGYFELAKGGTLFLDEIANLPPTIQVKLLRSVQDRQILPLGSGKNVTTDVRIIVASNVVLENEIQAGRFRADLFHRLNEFKIYLLPLRERREDILVLAERFRRETNAELRKNIK
jgi:transcriptional regulator with GAF, ATPase, and Fis domain